MKRFSSLFITLFFIIACQSQADVTQTIPANTSIPEITLTSTSQPTTPQATATRSLSIKFPEWVKNQETQILLVPVGTQDKGYENMALFNAKTGERFDIPFTEEAGDYFWLPDGSGFGFLPFKQKYFILYSIDKGIVNKVNLFDTAFKFYKHNDSGSFATPIQVTSSNINDPNFLFLDIWDSLSPDKNYLISNQEYNEDYINVHDISKDTVINIPKQTDEYYQLYSEWSPTSSKLAVVSVDQEFRGMNHSFQNLPTFRLRVFDIESETVVASYKNISFPNWSPDGTKFLFQEWKKHVHDYWYGGSPPCIFNTLDGKTKCFNEVLTHENPLITSLSWSPEQSMIGYVSDDGFCYLSLISIRVECILTSDELTNQYVLDYSWSSNEGFISFIFDIYQPFVDLTNNPKIGVADLNTGEFFVVGEVHSSAEPGLWRPLSNP